MMAARLALLLMLAAALRIWFTVEQPSGSVLFNYHRLQQVLQRVNVGKGPPMVKVCLS